MTLVAAVDAMDVDPASGMIEDLEDYFTGESASGQGRSRKALMQGNVSVMGSPWSRVGRWRRHMADYCRSAGSRDWKGVNKLSYCSIDCGGGL